MSPETEKQFAPMSQQFETIEEKIDFLIKKVDTITDKMLCKEDAEKTYVSKNEFLFLKGRNSFYALITPILTAMVGSLFTYILFR